MNMIIDQQFRAIVSAELQRRAWSKSDLARECGLSPQRVSEYLNGRYSPGTDVMERMLQALGKTPVLVAHDESAVSTAS